MSEVQHSIKIAARKSGLTAHVIRVWERRYNAVSPDRTDTNRRRYSDAEIERLTLLRAATQAGHSISSIAKLPVEKLRELAIEVIPASVPVAKRNEAAATQAMDAAIVAIEKLNSTELEEILGRAAVAFGQHGLLERVIAPLAQKVGELWRDGSITAAHEHFASAVIRNYLLQTSKPYAANGAAPVLVVGTPAGQLHELGAVMVAAAANDLGWRVIYLGTSLPAVEIAGAAIQNKARAVAMSIVFPDDDPNLAQELQSLRKHLPPEIKIITGGRASESYASVLEASGAIRTREISDLYRILEQMRAPA
jgi:MerR family transcriptional regulator, light-induced transcriptional regulator